MVRRSGVRWCTLHPPDKRRPVIILTRNSTIDFLTGITVAPVTSTIRDIPTQVLLTPDEDGVHLLSAVNLDNIQTVQKTQLGPLITTLSMARMREVERAVAFALGMDTFVAGIF